MEIVVVLGSGLAVALILYMLVERNQIFFINVSGDDGFGVVVVIISYCKILITEVSHMVDALVIVYLSIQNISFTIVLWWIILAKGIILQGFNVESLQTMCDNNNRHKSLNVTNQPLSVMWFFISPICENVTSLSSFALFVVNSNNLTLPKIRRLIEELL